MIERTYARAAACAVAATVMVGVLAVASPARADGNLQNVNHVIIVMQENHSFDNYFGVLPYVAGTPYHHGTRRHGCLPTDSTCVDGLACKIRKGAIVCSNSNRSNT